MLNVIDTVNVVNMANVEDNELLFIAKKSRLSDPIELSAEVADIVIQALYDGKPALKLRLDYTSVDFRMQDRGLLTNFSISVKLQ